MEAGVGCSSCIDPLQGLGKLRLMEARDQNAVEKVVLGPGGSELKREGSLGVGSP